MAKFTKYMFILLSATYFLFAGSGYNIVKYCSEGCKRVEIESTKRSSCAMKAVPLKGSCCEKEESEPDKKMSNNHMSHHSDDCCFKRVGVDIPLVETQKVVSKCVIKSIDLWNVIFSKPCSNKNIALRTVYPPPSNFFPMTGREILALKAVLLI